MLYVVHFDIGVPHDNHPRAVSWVHVMTWLKKSLTDECYTEAERNNVKLGKMHASKTIKES